ncbi:MAG: hypothetical protein KGZ83_13870 [Sulfuricella sp.]|nr:hypothetical protein [Sulfuricella sp.]
MSKTLLFVSLLLIGGLASVAHSESYQLSGKSYEMTWPTGGWNGGMSFPNVYCATAPFPEKAEWFTQAMFNRNTIYVGKIRYPNNLLLAVVFSSIPPGRSAEDDIAKLLATNRENQDRAKAASIVYEVSEFTTSFGPTLGLRLNNIESDTPGTGPFPLARRMLVPQDGALLSMSVHRLFARGPDRFEVAAMQIAPKIASDSTEKEKEKEMYDRLTAMVDTLTKSLQQCTEMLPARVPR